MKAALLALSAGALVGSVVASDHAGHARFHRRDGHLDYSAPKDSSCGCRTYTTTFYGEPTCESKDFFLVVASSDLATFGFCQT